MGHATDTSSSVRRRWRGAVAIAAALLLIPVTAGPAAAAAGAGTYENTSSPIATAGTWTTSASSQDSGGSVSYATRTATAALTFTGISVSWVSRTSPSSGINTVTIDGTRVATVDRYTADTRYQQRVYTSPKLPAGTHTIEVAFTNTKNPASTSANLIVDAFIVDEPVTPQTPVVGVGVHEGTSSAIGYAGNWSVMASTSDSGGSSQYLNSAGSATLRFTGDTVSWVSRVTPSAGIASVTVDGSAPVDVDRYSAATEYQKTVFTRSGLSAGTHTIKIAWTGRSHPAATGTNLLIDSIIVPDTTAPAAPGNPRSSLSTGDVVLAWDAVSDPGLAGYRIYRAVGSGGSKLIGTTPAGTTFFRALGVPADTSVAFKVSAVDGWGNESGRSAPTTALTGDTPAGSYRYANCPTATVTVSTPKELKAAAAAAGPDTVIRMAPGIWPGQMDISAQGSSGHPVWICGSRSVIIDGGGYASTSPITVSASSYLIVTGMVATNGLKGVTVRSSDHVTVSDMLVENIGYEGVHVRSNSTDSTVAFNTIRRTGQRDTFYGEGIYIGSSKNNWCQYTNCDPDRTDRIALIGNTIAATGSDLIEVKEGSTTGIIDGNSLDGSAGMASTESWLKVAGNDWVVVDNTGSNSSMHGFQQNADLSGWGLRNLFARNTGRVDAAGYGFKLWEPDGRGSTSTLVTCDNVITGAAAGFLSSGTCTD